MAPTGVVEPVDVLEHGSLSLTPLWPFLPPDELSLQGFEESLDGGVVIAIALATHRWAQTVGLQLLLIVVGAILAAAIGMEHAIRRRVAQAHSHIERPDCQIFLNPVIVIQIDGSSYRLRRHADLLPEHIRSNALITPPAPVEPRRRGRPPKNGGAAQTT